LVTANAEIAKLKAEAVIAKAASDKALADAQAAAKTELDSVKAANAKAIADIKTAYNDLIKSIKKAYPKAKLPAPLK
jgi:phage shock protein A